MSFVNLREWLYNAVGFAVRCDRSTAALSCIRIILMSISQVWQNAQFYIPSKRRKFWRELCRAAWYPTRCQRAHKTLKFLLFGGVVFYVGFTKNGDKMILQFFSFGNMELNFAFFTKIDFGHFIFNFLFGKSYRHPISIFTVTQ